MVREEEEKDKGLWECNVCTINVNGLLVKGFDKKTDIEVTMREEKIDVLLLQETKLSKDTDVSETFVEGFVEVRLVREGRGGGGVSTYLRNGMGIINSNGFSNGWIEVLAVTTKDTLYANVYKSPGISVEQFKEGLEFLYVEIKGKEVDLVVAGDFNLPRLGMWSPIEMAEMRTRIMRNRGENEGKGVSQQEILMMDFVESYFLDQVVKKPTRENATLDVVFTNAGKIRRVEIISNSYTDHRSVVVNMVGYDKDEEEVRDRGIIT